MGCLDSDLFFAPIMYQLYSVLRIFRHDYSQTTILAVSGYTLFGFVCGVKIKGRFFDDPGGDGWRWVLRFGWNSINQYCSKLLQSDICCSYPHSFNIYCNGGVINYLCTIECQGNKWKFLQQRHQFVDQQYVSGIHPAPQFVSGQQGMWVVWDVKVGQSGYFARFGSRRAGGPSGFSPYMINGEVLGYSRYSKEKS